jgi:hypothetical protein
MLKKLQVRYLLLDSGFNKFSIYLLSYYNQGGGTINLAASSPINVNYGLPTISMTGTVRNFLIITGMNVTTSDSTNQLDISGTATRTTSTTLKLTITTTLITAIGIKGLNFLVMSYN